MKLKCQKCGGRMEKVLVDVEGAENKSVSYQCDRGHIEFEKESAAKVVKELKTKESPLKIRQKLLNYLATGWDSILTNT